MLLFPLIVTFVSMVINWIRICIARHFLKLMTSLRNHLMRSSRKIKNCSFVVFHSPWALLETGQQRHVSSINVFCSGDHLKLREQVSLTESSRPQGMLLRYVVYRSLLTVLTLLFMCIGIFNSSNWFIYRKSRITMICWPIGCQMLPLYYCFCSVP